MILYDRTFSDLLELTGMSPRTLRVWQGARTLGDLAELTARWLEGDLGEQPGYGSSDIEENPELVPVLAALNRAGYLITCSQAAWVGGDVEHWENLAAAEGFTDEETARRIVTAAADAGLTVVVHAPPPWWSRRPRLDRAVNVNWLNGQPAASLGVRSPRWHLRDPRIGYGICHPDAVKAVCNAWQVTVIDLMSCRPEYLWNTLARTLINGKEDAAA